MSRAAFRASVHAHRALNAQARHPRLRGDDLSAGAVWAGMAKGCALTVLKRLVATSGTMA